MISHRSPPYSLITGLAVALATTFVPSATARTYMAKSVSGGALVWPLDGSGWQQVTAGAQLAEESLVQVPSGSRLVIDIADGTAKSRLVLTEPTVLRLNERIVRRQTFSMRHIIPERAKPDAQVATGVMRDAWERVIALLVKGDDAKVVLSAKTELGVKMQTIEVLSPISSALVLTSDFPAAVDVAWKDPAAQSGERYEVYFWEPSARDLDGAPYTVTTGKRYHVDALHAGDYLVQIKTIDHTRQSRAQRITIDKRLADTTVTSRAEGHPGRLETLFPPAGFVVVTQTPMDIPFSWRATPQASAYELELHDRRSGRVRVIRVTEASTSLRLHPATDFTWIVRAVDVTAPFGSGIALSLPRESTPRDLSVCPPVHNTLDLAGEMIQLLRGLHSHDSRQAWLAPHAAASPETSESSH